jgi:site-specific DNA-methyltransferase (adenine-specific)
MNTALLSSKRMDWNTPEEVLELVRKVAPIGLDPCSNPASTVNARENWYSNGLTNGWDGVGLVYVNPPYGRELKQWAEKIAAEADRGVEIIALVPARTDTKWFRQMFFACTCVCLWKGRITFAGATYPAPFPSAVFYYGTNFEGFCGAFHDAGIITS